MAKEHSNAAGLGPITLQLIEANQIHPDRVLDRSVLKKATWLVALLAAWGVISGFAIFLNVQEEAARLELHPGTAGPSPLVQFVVPLFFASCVAFISEMLRELIKEGDAIHEADAIPDDKPHGIGLLPKLVVSVFMLALFEFYITAWHGVIEAGIGGELGKRIMETVLPGLRGQTPSNALLIVLVLLWVLSGALLVGFLGWIVFRLLGRSAARAKSGMWYGTVAAAVVAPAGVFAYIAVVELYRGIHSFFAYHGMWSMSARALSERYEHSSIPFATFVFGTPVALDELWREVQYGPAITLVAIVAIAAACWRFRQIRFLGWMLLAGFLAAFAVPLFTAGAGKLYLIPVLAGVIWLVPGAILGALAPALRRPASAPLTWGLLAFGAAGLLLLLRILQLADRSFVYPALTLIVAGVLLIRSRRVQDYWPLMALSVAMLICGTTLIQQATFFGILERLYGVLAAPDFVESDTARLSFHAMYEFTGMVELFELDRAIKDSADLKPQEQVARLEALQTQVKAREITEADLAWRAVYWPDESIHSPFRSLIEKEDPELVAPILALSQQPPERYREAVADLQRKVAAKIALHPRTQKLSLPADFSEQVHSESVFQPSAEDIKNIFDIPGGSIMRFVTPSLLGVQDPLRKSENRQCAKTADSEECALLELQYALGERLKDYDSVDKEKTAPAQMDSFPSRNTVDKHDFTHETRPGRQLSELLALEKTIGDLRKGAEEREDWDGQHVGQHLELSLAGSLGFWTTAGFLAGWSLLRRQPLVIADGGHQRCFWAKGGLQAYHDDLHGTAVTNDGELFSRLALALSGADRTDHAMPVYRDVFQPLTVGTVAEWNLADLKTYFQPAPALLSKKQFAPLTGLPVVARKFLQLASNGNPAAAVETIATQSLVEDKIAWCHRELALPLDFPAGGFLQSVGLLPEAHMVECERHGMQANPNGC